MILPIFLIMLLVMLWVQLTIEGFESLWTEEKMNYSGNDMDNLTGISLNNCKKKCMMNTQCKGIVAEGDHCWLKSAWGEGIPDDKKNTYKITRRS